MSETGSLRPLVTVIGGGLAGCEAAWQLAVRGVPVRLVEMKPLAMSPAHRLEQLCELVCSNSLRSDDPATPAGLLKDELRRAGSLVIACADRQRVPAGAALAVDREAFAEEVTRTLRSHPLIEIEISVASELPQGPAIVATGPLTAGALADHIAALCGTGLYFYDAIAPIVAVDSIDFAHAFRASRWGVDSAPGGAGAGEVAELPCAAGGCGADEPETAGGDYINCTLTEPQYRQFVNDVRAGRKVVPHAFEEPRYFEGCLPIEVMAERGDDVLRFGPMRPVGLVDPRTGRRPFAVVQLRPENRYLSAYNLVGFQTRLAHPEQQRIFSTIPALREAEFLRYGSIHRNTYIDAPRLLGPEFQLRERPELRFAGLLTGVEGYIESCAIGLLAALFTEAGLRGRSLPPPPPTTALGGLHHHVTRPRGPGESFTPTNINFGLLPGLERRAPKRERKRLVAERAQRALGPWLAQVVTLAA
jgi:methylenetetrahydrofolate--tRNA-(uracil-5-)-methyltransferase